jgi:hypothetical protein
MFFTGWLVREIVHDPNVKPGRFTLGSERLTMKWISSLILSVLSVSAIRVQADVLPTFPAETLSKKSVSFPEDLPPHPTLMIIAFTKEASAETERWSRETRPLTNNLNLVVYDLAVIEDAPRLVRGTIKKSLRKRIPESMHESFFVVTQDSQVLKKAADYDDSEDAFLVLLDDAHTVIWKSSGTFTKEKLSGLSGIAGLNVEGK